MMEAKKHKAFLEIKELLLTWNKKYDLGFLALVDLGDHTSVVAKTNDENLLNFVDAVLNNSPTREAAMLVMAKRLEMASAEHKEILTDDLSAEILVRH